MISEYDAPHRFVDEQQSGPFRRWWHEHRFEPATGGTLMTDVVEFVAPAGVVGRLANVLVLTRYMTKLLERRNAWLKNAFQS
ncbi:hypothetical protein ACIRON_06625 [Nocardioides sp. NPDC101246]|uniref:SRPBCC family protein n=1 Tax=Nocardioides sp. NPDC101246 TaxID=3364336 RepID=UPI00382F7FD5